MCRKNYMQHAITSVYRYIYARSYVMDGNFSAENMRMRRPQNDIPSTSGKSFMVEDRRYKQHLKVAKEVTTVRDAERALHIPH